MKVQKFIESFCILYLLYHWSTQLLVNHGPSQQSSKEYRKILHISYKDHVTNEEVRAKIQQAIGPHEDLLTIVKRRNLQWYGRVSRSWGLAKNHLARHSERGKKTRRIKEEVGRQHQGMDRTGVRQVPEGCGEQGKWRKLVVKSSVVPQRPSQLRDWWWWWWWH